jgi:hypothetical protein
MEDDYKEEDQPTQPLVGFAWLLDAVYRNVAKQAMRGLLFGLGHYLTYRLLGGYIIQRYPSLDG